MNTILWITIVIVFIILLVGIDYTHFIRERNNVREGFLVASTHFGKVEYLDIGPKEGPVILFSTGGGAGIDAVTAFDWLVERGYRIISINRPGYYNLPVDVANSIKEHAKIYYEVIQSLDISEVNVLGVSMGGLSSLYYAQSYPVKSMVLWSAVTKEYRPNQKAINSLLGRLVMTDKGKNLISWMMLRSAQIFPRATIGSFLKTEADLDKRQTNLLINSIVNDEYEKRQLLQFVKSMTPMGALHAGMMDEIEKSALPQSINWDKINMPVLAIHSTIDKDVGYEHFESLKNNLVNGTFISVEAGGHFIWWGPKGREVIRNTLEFFDKINK